MAMDVILLERVEHLGQMGDTVSVKPGYARNFLIPQKKALRATAQNRKLFEARRAQLEAQNLQKREEAEAVAAKMDGVSIVMVRQAGEAGHLYGSVAARDVADALKEEGYTVSRGQIRMDRVIKELGRYDVVVALHPEVSVTVTVAVGRTAEEAALSAADAEALLDEEGLEALAEDESFAVETETKIEAEERAQA